MTRALTLLLLLAALAPAPARAEPTDEAAREAEMFGGSAEEKQREADMFGGPAEEEAEDETQKEKPASPLDEPVRSAGAIRDLLQEADDPLTIGGQLSLRFQYTWADEFADEEHSVTSPNVVYLFLDARPSDRLRAFVRGRLMYDPTLQDGLDASGLPADSLAVALDQLWLKADIYEVVYVTAGRQPIRWGSSRFWNPTDILNQQRRDPLAIFDERVGPTLLKLHFPVESLGWNFYAIGGIDLAKHPDRVTGAVRGEFLVGPVEAAISAGYGKDQPLRLGADLSAGFWLVDLRFEAGFAYDDSRPHYTGQLDLATGKTPVATDRSDRWIPQLTLGGELQFMITDQDYLLIGVEYFHNGAGYPDADLYDWLLLRSASGEQGAFTPFYLGRHYFAAYALLPSPGSWDDTTISLSGLANLSDRTGLLRLDWRVRVLTYLDLALFASVRMGDHGEFHYGVKVPPLTGVPGVPDAYSKGFTIPASRLDLGLWATLAL